MAIPLPWLQLTREKIRLLVALAGIGFADILMFMQLGFQEALYNSAIRLHKELEGDIFLISPQSTAIIAMQSFSQRHLYQALGFEGVESVTPIYLDFGLWKNPDVCGTEYLTQGSLPVANAAETTPTVAEESTDASGATPCQTRGILVIGINPQSNVLSIEGVQRNLDRIRLPDVVLFDQASRGEFGAIAEAYNRDEVVDTEVSNRRVEVRGLYELGASFGANGTILTSDLNFLRIFKNRDKGIIDVGMIQVEPGVEVEPLTDALEAHLSDDVMVLSKQEFINFEKNYWKTNTAIGFIFTLGTGMGFVVGIVIVYQVLYTEVADHLAEYATLKAMGYADRYLLLVVFQEALILAVIGYLPGFGLSLVLYNMTKAATSLPVMMTVARAIAVLILTIVMCVISGAIAVRKLSAADPADIF